MAKCADPNFVTGDSVPGHKTQVRAFGVNDMNHKCIS